MIRLRLFLIAGKSGSGKSEVAKLIMEFYEKKNKKALITEYSKYLKLYAKEMLGWDGNSLTKPRTFLQEIGSFVRENLKLGDLLIRRMKTDMLVYERFFDVVIISDVRYPDEILKMKDYHPISILVKNEFEDSPLSVKEANHISEHALDDFTGFDFTIVNHYEKNLKNEVYELLEDLK